MEGKTYQTNYDVAVNWLHNSYVLCNNIVEIDNSVAENLMWDDEDPKEIYQWFLSNCTEEEVERLTSHFNLLFAYSNLLDLYVLAVPHYGTSWKYVPWVTDIWNAQAELGDIK